MFRGRYAIKAEEGQIYFAVLLKVTQIKVLCNLKNYI